MAKMVGKRLYSDGKPTEKEMTAFLYVGYLDELAKSVNDVMVNGAYFAQGEQFEEYKKISHQLIEYRNKAREFVNKKKEEAGIE